MTPQRLHIDQDSAFRGGYAFMCEAMTIQLVPVPAGAYVSNGKVERRILTIKEISVRMFHDMQATDDDRAHADVPRIAETCNRLYGFSPAQCVLGDGVQLAGPAVDVECPCASTQLIEGSAFWHRLRLQGACEVSYRQAKHSAALRRAGLHQASPQPGPFETGSWIHRWRSRGVKRAAMGRWHSIIRALARGEFGYWVFHNGVALLCSPDCMRFSTATEVTLLARKVDEALSISFMNATRSPRATTMTTCGRETLLCLQKRCLRLTRRSPRIRDSRRTTDRAMMPRRQTMPAALAIATKSGHVGVPVWDVIVGVAARAPNEVVQAFRLVDITFLPGERTNVDPRDLRRRRVLQRHNQALMEYVLRAGQFSLVVNLTSVPMSWESSHIVYLIVRTNPLCTC